MDIIPGILTDNPQELRDMVEKADGVVKRIHVDIIDGVYSENKTIDPSALEVLEHDLLIDFHLMVNEPVKWVEKCIRAGGDRIIGHVEMMSSPLEFIGEVTEAGLSPGLALDIDTPVGLIEKMLLTDVDIIVVMSVPAGYGGQKFDERALDKIKALRKIKKSDQGGVSLEYIDDISRVGADEVVIGNRLFEGDLKSNIEKFVKST